MKKILKFGVALAAVLLGLCLAGCGGAGINGKIEIGSGTLTQEEFRRICPNYATISEYTIPDSYTEIARVGYIFTSDAPFYGCNRLEKVTIPASIATIGQCAFAGCDWLSSVTVLATLPPVFNGGSGLYFNTSLPNFTIYVPAESLDKYKEVSADWRQYAEYIKPIQ